MTLPQSPSIRSPAERTAMVLAFVALLGFIYTLLPDSSDELHTNYCPQPEIIPLKGNFMNSTHFYTDEYKEYSLKAMQGALRVPTESFDDMDLDPKREPRFEIFKKLHKHLFEFFPLTAKNVEIVNEYGLLYTFKGKNRHLKPLVLMSHQDVVPVPESTVSQWDYPPFEAHFDGEWLYARGAADTKDSLVGILEATESLLSQDWEPERTLIISYGFDEEIGGPRGAGALAAELEKRYGKDGIEAVIDEGFGLPSMYGSLVGAVTVAEKGYVDIEVSLQTPGGHSSIPPDHTSIGIMSKLVKLLESSPFQPTLQESNPTLGLYRCLAEHSPRMNKELRRTVLDLEHGDHHQKLLNYIDSNPLEKYLIRTSQAVDVIKGGVKINALPERVELKVNHRVDPSSGTLAVVERFEDLVSQIAQEFNLGVESHGETLFERTDRGMFNITTSRELEPAPIAPHTGLPWNLIGSTTLSVFRAWGIEEPIVMAPTLFPANTDTKHYWGLTRAIYRYKPVLQGDILNYHTVNERLRFRSHLMTVAWFYELIINATL